MKYRHSNLDLERLESEVLEDIRKRIPLGDTLYEIAMDHRVSELRVRRWVVPILEQYKQLRGVWIGKLIAEQGKKIPSEEGK